MPVMPSPGWNVTSAEVSSRCGGLPACASACDNAIEKHAEWAAAISSSGLVRPLGSSARDAHVTGNFPTPDDSRLTSPDPSKSAPSHRVVACRVVAMAADYGPVTRDRDRDRAVHRRGGRGGVGQTD